MIDRGTYALNFPVWTHQCPELKTMISAPFQCSELGETLSRTSTFLPLLWFLSNSIKNGLQ